MKGLRTLLLGTLVGGLALVSGGCATPAYTGGPASVKFPEEKMSGESSNRIVRNMYWDSRMLVDDVNSALLLDPMSRLTKWNLR